ncbi:MAG: response regulator, partial [Cyanobacteria bacterium REEB65]|nr:response regulator [Cyanobacteria bacterium REEB65]
MLQREGLDILVAAEGREALHLARLHRPALVIVDADLPGISGFGVCQCLKEDPDLSHLPVLLYSQEPPGDFREKAWASGAYDILNVPFEAHVIVEKVSHAVLGLPAIDEAAVLTPGVGGEGFRSSVRSIAEGRKVTLAPPAAGIDAIEPRFPRHSKVNVTFTDGNYTATQWSGRISKTG